MTDRPYPWATEPREHQRDLFDRTKDKDAFGVFWDMGLGKTKFLIDTACYQYLCKGSIDGVLVVAPNIVHHNWVAEEVPIHAPPEARVRAVAWYAAAAGTVKQAKACEGLLDHDGLPLLAMTYEGICTDNGRTVARKFMTHRRTMMVLDESHRIKTAGGKRTKMILAAGEKLAKARRIATGTPIGNRPFDLYTQIKFLDPDFWWREFGIASYHAFKARFGIWITQHFGPKRVPRLEGYTRLDELTKGIQTISHRLTAESAGLKLPPQIYVRRRYALSRRQREVYDALVADYTAELAAGRVLEAPLALVRLMRLHQIACGFAPTLADGDGEVTWIPGDRPRLDALKDVLTDLDEPVIIWACHQEDCRIIVEMINTYDAKEAVEDDDFRMTTKTAKRSKFGGAVKVDGTVPDQERIENLDAWKAGKVRCLVANPAALGVGVTLTRAKVVIYYSQDFNLINRQQSEKRAHRIGQEHPVTYVDMEAEGTIDKKVIDALVSKADIAGQVMGDKFKEWIR